ncbi:MAG: hypothetical protein H6677_16725 [Candidatus Obscuribacterales bacterium]|nr:hypothetical protein [Cyanobacteria bacterium HKST-UBA01]MCB9469917.1 hypothetical protein [Candidatus Obscuribacterales bacterium]
MTGDEKMRACSLCSKNVYNISNMTRQEAEDLLLSNEPGSVCVGYFRRSDGTIVTDDCPVGLKRLRNGCRWLLRTAAAAVSLLLSANIFGVGKVWASDYLDGKQLLFSHPKRARFGAANSWKAEHPVSVLKIRENKNSLKEAVKHSPLVVVAEFESMEHETPIKVFGPASNYRVKNVLKGVYDSESISVYERFESAPVVSTSLKHSDSAKVSKQSEKFILFLSPSKFVEGIWNTYSRSYGRLDANELNLKAVKSEIAKQSTKLL